MREISKQILTDEDIRKIHDTYHKRMGPVEFARAIESAILEKIGEAQSYVNQYKKCQAILMWHPLDSEDTPLSH